MDVKTKETIVKGVESAGRKLIEMFRKGNNGVFVSKGSHFASKNYLAESRPLLSELRIIQSMIVCFKMEGNENRNS